MLSHISIDLVINHFNERVVTHNQLCQLLENNNIEEFVDIAIGINEAIPNGNYSASEHSLGERIISSNHDVYNRIFHFAQEVYQAHQRLNIPRIIRGLDLSYLKISVGSEIATMLRPDIYWVANVRTLWTQAYINNNFSINSANEYIKVLRQKPDPQDIRDDYNMWASLYPTLENSLREISRIGNDYADKSAPTNNIFLWADAISSELFAQRA